MKICCRASGRARGLKKAAARPDPATPPPDGPCSVVRLSSECLTPRATANPRGGLPLALDGVAHRLNPQAVSPDFRPAESPPEFLKPYRAGLLELADPLLHPRRQRSRPGARRQFRVRAASGLLLRPLALGTFDYLKPIITDHIAFVDSGV